MCSTAFAAIGALQPINTYDLRRRRYLGPTSMDTEMAFLMCNMAQARRYGAAAWHAGLLQSCGVLWRSPAAGPACPQASALPGAARGLVCSWGRTFG